LAQINSINTKKGVIMQNKKTNTELVTGLMDFSRFGAISQLFVIEALTRYATEVLENQAEVREAFAPKKSPDQKFLSLSISPDAWIGVAGEVKQALEDNYGA
jgi:hypothetical protein